MGRGWDRFDAYSEGAKWAKDNLQRRADGGWVGDGGAE